jgi:RNA-directed DNA polymerase
VVRWVDSAVTVDRGGGKKNSIEPGSVFLIEIWFDMAKFAPLSGLRTRADVANYIGTSVAQLQLLLYARHECLRYREFTIAKRRGGTRVIFAPQEDLKLLQRKLADKLTETAYRPRNVAYGFIAGRSIRGNADQHLRSRYVMNVDLKDFFPSIHFGRVSGLFEALGAGKAAATVLAQICCHKKALPQGAPTSPVVSNMICATMDAKLLALATKYHCTYTRYADDLTFSKRSGSFPPEIGRLDEEQGRAILGNELREIIDASSFAPHPDKAWLFSRQGRQSVTGLIVNKKRNVRREWVRQLRAMIHAWKIYGLEFADAEYKKKYHKGQKRNGEPANLSLVVRGKMDFLKMIKGMNDPVYKLLQRRLVEIDPEYFSVMERENSVMLKRDVFISHASEDKAEVAKELADRLIAEGITVWYDEYSVRLGDDLLHKIDEGLVNSQFGVVIFSPNFFAAKKTWTPREYSGLVAGEDVDKEKRIIPVWHKITREELYRKSPTIANRLALLTSKMTIEEMAKKIAERVRQGA